MNALAQLLLKAGATAVGAISAVPGEMWVKLSKIPLQPFIIGGLACYVVSVALWIIALSRVDVSVAYPMLSIGYVVNAFAAWYLFGEPLSTTRMAGITVIMLGVFLLAKS